MSSFEAEFGPQAADRQEAPATVVLDDPEALAISVVLDPAEIAADWKALQANAEAPFCDFAWAKAWYDAQRGTAGRSAAIAIGHAHSGEPLFILPLSLERRGPFRVLVWPGGTHASYHSGLFSARCRTMLDRANAKRFWARVFAALPEADAFVGYGLPQFEIEAGNPLQYLPLFECGCNAYRLSLSDDWESVYHTSTSAKTRSNDRRCERRLGEMGAVRFRIAVSRAERQELLQVLIAQKSARLGERGVPDIFQDATLRAFYQNLVTSSSWSAERSVFLSALEFDGRIIAVNLGLIHGHVFHGMVLSMEGGEFERYGPGRMLVRRSVEHLSRNGIACIDFGAGEDSYKENWCDTVVPRRDVLVAFGARGQLFITGFKFFVNSKAAIKHSPVLWRLFSRYRRYLGC